jgi:hypothetical protein
VLLFQPDTQARRRLDAASSVLVGALKGGDRLAASFQFNGGDYLGCAPICFMSVSESKYWRLDLILLSSKV